MSSSNYFSHIWTISQEYGGFTVSLDKLEPVRAGWAIGHSETQNRFGESGLMFVIEHSLRTTRIVGGWYNDKDGNYYFDMVIIEFDEAVAIELMKQHRQLAIYQIDTGRVIENRGGDPFYFQWYKLQHYQWFFSKQRNAMEAIKNLKRLNLSNEENERLENLATMQKRYSNITFEVLDKDTPTIKVKQGKTFQKVYFDQKRLIEIAKETFEPFVDKIHVHATEYVESPIEVVKPEWIGKEMNQLKIKLKDMVPELGVEKAELSAMINGHRPISQRSKAMFYYYFVSKAHEHAIIVEKYNNSYRLKQLRSIIQSHIDTPLSLIYEKEVFKKNDNPLLDKIRHILEDVFRQIFQEMKYLISWEDLTESEMEKIKPHLQLKTEKSEREKKERESEKVSD
ncbi:hypothetical protein [Xanthocytophaga flava]|uniref:hypothetical protein n=1 Tax=Xanthocytophaga flava TaxID=3048013 RepID=UPI0028D90887|nr:hypothetical protein [Xanthocytophaga flavus]MDJ1470339.1 hypothetical protein [Xanthocytophaga flavus]